MCTTFCRKNGKSGCDAKRRRKDKRQKGWNSMKLGLDNFWIVLKDEQDCCTTLPSRDRGEEAQR